MLCRHRVGDALQLGEQVLIHLKPPRRVDDDDVGVHAARFPQRLAGDRDGIGAARRVSGRVDAFGQDLELFHGGRTANVGRYQQRPVPFATSKEGELAGGRRLTRAL